MRVGETLSVPEETIKHACMILGKGYGASGTLPPPGPRWAREGRFVVPECGVGGWLEQFVIGLRVPAAVEVVRKHRDAARVQQVLSQLPGLLRDATAQAHASKAADSWMTLSEVYSSVYWLAARHRWMDMAELAVTRQRRAVEQQSNPLGEAIAARDRAGAYLNGGDAEGGLLIVDRAIARAETALSGQDRAFAVGVLNLRGMTLAGRLEDKGGGCARGRATHRLRAAGWRRVVQRRRREPALDDLRAPEHSDARPCDEARPRPATRGSWGGGDARCRSRRTTGDASRSVQVEPCPRSSRPGNREAALRNLSEAWDVAPQMARIHPMAREVFRVLASLHRRSNPELLRLSQMSGMPLC